MKPLTVTFGPTWPEHIALPAEGAQVGTVRLRATARLADGAGATIGEITGRLIVQAGQIVARGAGDLPLKILGSDRAPGSPRAPRYEVREVLTVDGRDIPQTFVIEPYESTTAPGTWDYRSPPVQGITYVNGLPLSLEQAQQYAADAQDIVTQGQALLTQLDAEKDNLPAAVNTAVQAGLAPVGAALVELDAATDRSDLAAAQALGVAGISATYVSNTMADPPAAPDGTRGAKRDASGNLVLLTRTSGAWVPDALALASLGTVTGLAPDPDAGLRPITPADLAPGMPMMHQRVVLLDRPRRVARSPVSAASP